MSFTRFFLKVPNIDMTTNAKSASSVKVWRNKNKVTYLKMAVKA
jgi:hypothetical protein